MKVLGRDVIPLQERIRSRSIVDPTTGCWVWTGAVRSREAPYGRLVIGSRTDQTRRTVAAHRLSFLVFNGPLGDGLCVCHRCDNPSCVNPEHLFAGTKKDNADDRDRKGRLKRAPVLRGENAPWSKLTDAQVAEIKRSRLGSRPLARRLGVSDSHVRAIRRGKWRSAPPVSAPPKRREE